MTEISHCPFCQSNATSRFHSDNRRDYRRCTRCSLVFVPPQFYLELEVERAEYDKHRNIPDDPGYRRFLSRLATPMLERLAPASEGLDFGCGPCCARAGILA